MDTSTPKLVKIGRILVIVGLADFVIGLIVEHLIFGYAGYAFFQNPLYLAFAFLSDLTFPIISVGIIVWIIGSARAPKLPKDPTVKTSRKSILFWNVLAILTLIVAGFMIAFVGAMSSDSGTPAAYATAKGILIGDAIYFVAGIISVIISQVRRSLIWTKWPVIFPVLLLGLLFTAALLQSLWFLVTGH